MPLTNQNRCSQKGNRNKDIHISNNTDHQLAISSDELLLNYQSKAEKQSVSINFYEKFYMVHLIFNKHRRNMKSTCSIPNADI